MVLKGFFSALLVLSCVLYASAEITKDDTDALKSAWKKFSANSLELTKTMYDDILDKVVTPLMDQLFDLLDFIIPKSAKPALLKVMPLVKQVAQTDMFKTIVHTMVDVISHDIIPKVDKFVDIANHKEEYLTKRIHALVTLGVKLYHRGLELATPVVKQFMEQQKFSPEEQSAVERILTELSKIDMAEIKRIFKKV